MRSAVKATEIADSTSSFAEMLCALAHHRQRGADLIFAAYAVDIGGG
jgi:hypothetical protein